MELAATATIDATLAVGGSGEVVEVTAAEPLLDTASASGGQLFSKQQIQDLPNLGRNPFIFEKLDSNVVATGDPRYVRAEDQTGLSQVSVAGAPIGANNYAVDGIPISRSDGGVTFIPSPEAVSDAKVQANAYDAEVGRTGGGLFNTSLTSGSVCTTAPCTARRARHPGPQTFGSIPTSLPRQTTPPILYAGAIGGPLFPFIEKKIKPLRNTFFWVTEEGYRQAQFYPGSSAVTRVPTTGGAQRRLSQGDSIPALRSDGFLHGRHPYGNPRRQRDSCWVPECGGQGDPERFSTAPNTTGNGFNFNQLNTFKTRSDMYSGKLEHTFAPWWTTGVSYVHLGNAGTQRLHSGRRRRGECKQAAALQRCDRCQQHIYAEPNNTVNSGLWF